jgi:F-type H+-transporting ATPase subunit gamma
MPSFCRLFAKSILCVGTDIGRLAPQFADASKVASAILNSGFEFDNGTLYYNRFKLVIKFNIIVHVRI